MQRRIERADGDGKAGHRLQDAAEVVPLERQELGERVRCSCGRLPALGFPTVALGREPRPLRLAARGREPLLDRRDLALVALGIGA